MGKVSVAWYREIVNLDSQRPVAPVVRVCVSPAAERNPQLCKDKHYVTFRVEAQVTESFP